MITSLQIVGRLLAGGLFACVACFAHAESDANWKLGKANDKTTCKALWRSVGLPRYPDTPARDVTLVCRMRYVLSHDNTARTADWVLERLKKAQVSGKNKRPKQSFLQDRFVPPHGRGKNGDYTNTQADFARGHLAPSEDFNQKIAWMTESFVYSNAVPQVAAKFNGAIWGSFEEEVRKAARARGEIYVITGPVRGEPGSRTHTILKADNDCGDAIVLDGPAEAVVCDANNKNPQVACAGGVAVPIALYKIIYDPKARSVYAFVLPNRDHPSKTGAETRPYLDGFRTTLAVVEGLTGLGFFTNFPDAQRNALLRQCPTQPLWAQ